MTASAVSTAVEVVRDHDRLRGRLSSLRRRLLEELREPASATALAARLGERRQRINYHLRELEKAGLVELVEERARRGCTERVVRASARAVIVRPEVAGDLATTDQDRFAVDTLLALATRTVDEVATMRERAAAAGTRLVTFTIEANVGFARPADIERFAAELGERVAELAATYDAPNAGRKYQLMIAGHPARGTGEGTP